MKELDLQKFLREHPDNWKEILKKSPFELIINEYPDGRVIFKYVQFASDFTKELVRESRGIILQKGTWDVVCLPFSKFFNFGEPNAFDLCLTGSSIIEKTDGSIIKVYFYDGKWRVATNGTIEAEDASTRDDKITFKDLFFDVISPDRFEELTSFYFHRDDTYLFELIHPMNRVVVDYHGKKELIFIGCRNNKSFVDDDIFILQYPFVKKFEEIRLPRVFMMHIYYLSELSKIADDLNLNGADFEGFVVVETGDFEVKGRIKIKSPKYLKLHRLTGGEGVSNNIINILLDGEQDEFEAYMNQLPSYIKDEYEETKAKYEKLLVELESCFSHFKKMSEEVSRKELAFSIIKEKPNLKGLIFTHIDHGKNPVDLLRNQLNSTKKVKYLLEKI